ncbi:MAG: hypothetical protein ACLFPX_00540 [Candidatus Omnitrophota bacterium]
MNCHGEGYRGVLIGTAVLAVVLAVVFMNIHIMREMERVPEPSSPARSGRTSTSETQQIKRPAEWESSRFYNDTEDKNKESLQQEVDPRGQDPAQSVQSHILVN